MLRNNRTGHVALGGLRLEKAVPVRRNQLGPHGGAESAGSFSPQPSLRTDVYGEYLLETVQTETAAKAQPRPLLGAGGAGALRRRAAGLA